MKKNKYYQLQETQGQRKMKQFLSELFENDVFEQEFQKIKSIKNLKKRNKAFQELAEKYFLLFEFGTPLIDYIYNQDPKFHKSIDLDMCIIRDEVDEYLNPIFKYEFDTPPSRRPKKKLELQAYPIHVCINPKASKRDVIDFVKKRWKYIRNLLDLYEEDPPRIRKRIKEKRDAFIWKHKNLPSEEIAKITNEKFPKEKLVYSDINKILHKLKKRMKSNLA